MPVEIQNLQISANITPDALKSDGKSSGDCEEMLSGRNREALVQECVDQVLEILKRSREY